MKFSISKGSYVFMGCSFDCSENLYLGKNSVINAKCRIDTRGKVIIGENVSISNDVTILTADHDMNTYNLQGRIRDVKIGDYVWIGTRALIMPGVIVGKGAIVAAGSIVTKNVEPFQVVAGVPARTIRKRPAEKDFEYNASYKRLFQ